MVYIKRIYELGCWREGRTEEGNESSVMVSVRVLCCDDVCVHLFCE